MLPDTAAALLRYVPVTMGQKLSSKGQLSLPPKIFTMPGVKQVDLWAFKASLVYSLNIDFSLKLMKLGLLSKTIPQVIR